MSERETNKEGSGLHKGLTRRDFLMGATAAGALFTAAPLLSACGSGTSTATESASSSAQPKTGGHLRLGQVGGDAKDTVDPHVAEWAVDDANNWLMYQGLVEYSPDLTPQLVLAEEVTPNADASEWTVRVKPDIPWHDGRTLTADDVVFSFQRIVDPKKPLSGSSALAGLKPQDVTKVDERTVKFKFDASYVTFGTDGLANRFLHIVPTGFDPKKPVGSGAFKFVSGVPGEKFEFAAFNEFPGEGPYIQEISMTEYKDPTARVNAFLSGQEDAICELPTAQLALVQSSGDIKALNAKSGGWIPIAMNMSVKPFTDVRVRQAFRLMADRKQILENAYSGIGWIANDIYSPFDKGYPGDLPQREQDVEQAKSLLKQAGYDNNLTVTLTTSDACGTGAVAAATVYSEQAKAAGVTIKVSKVDSSIIYGDNWLSWPFAMDWWGLRNYLQQAAISCVPDAMYNETHWSNSQWLKLVQEANKTVDDAKRNELVKEAETIQYNDGAYLIPTFKNQLDAYSSKLAGWVTNDVMGIPLGRYRLNQVYFTA